MLDTIAAIATGLSEAGIGIIRVSGETSVAVVDKIFRNKSGKRILMSAKSHTIHYGYIVENPVDVNYPENGEGKETWKKYIVDEVMVSVMLAPYSYTTEDIVEINCHGGILVLQKVLSVVLKNGARMAEPGEFTKRAFLGGRIDLSEAEAVIDIIQSQNNLALETSVRQLKGSVSEKIKSLRKEIIYEIAFIESALDDPEHISLENYGDILSPKLEGIFAQIQKLIDSAEDGRLIRDGVDTVILGKPNAGKSSLLNYLLKEDRAIVTSIPGTTRDVLRESVFFQGIHFNIMDTAGIRQTDDVIEKLGVEKTREYAANADLILYVVDTSVPLDENDQEIISFIKGKNVIVLLNKDDLAPVTGEREIRELLGEGEIPFLTVSVLHHTGMDALGEIVGNMFFQGKNFHGLRDDKDEIIITSLRHKEELERAADSIRLVLNSISQGLPEDFYTVDLMDAYSSLGRIIGEEVGEDLVNEIFSKFCMGK